MTLLPSAEFGIRGVEGKAYDVESVCAAPGCGRPSVHVHHLWPRSFLRGQPYEWVGMPDGTVIGNRVGLCVEHHEPVTGMIGGHRAKIVFESGVFWWEEKAPDQPPILVARWVRTGALVYQPPGAIAREHPAIEAVNDGLDEVCPSCGKPKAPKRKLPRLARRNTKEWTLVVPDDMEIGAELLDTWADDVAEILGFSDESSRLRRYHAIATTLAYVITNRKTFVEDLAKATNS
jgi:hypothetical protein